MTDEYAKIVKKATRELRDLARLRQELNGIIKEVGVASKPEVRKEMALIDECIKGVQDVIRIAKQRMH